MQERDALTLFPQTTAFELAQIMRYLLLDDQLDSNVQARILMRWAGLMVHLPLQEALNLILLSMTAGWDC